MCSEHMFYLNYKSIISDTNQTLQTKIELILCFEIGVPCLLQTQKRAEIIPIDKVKIKS